MGGGHSSMQMWPRMAKPLPLPARSFRDHCQCQHLANRQEKKKMESILPKPPLHRYKINLFYYQGQLLDSYPLNMNIRLKNYRLDLRKIVKITMKKFSKQILIYPSYQFTLPCSCSFSTKLLSCLSKVYFSKWLFRPCTKKVK